MGLTSSDFGRIEPLPLAWSCDRLRRVSPIGLRRGESPLTEPIAARFFLARDRATFEGEPSVPLRLTLGGDAERGGARRPTIVCRSSCCTACGCWLREENVQARRAAGKLRSYLADPMRAFPVGVRVGNSATTTPA